MCVADAFDDGQDAVDLLLRGDGSAGARAGGFAADVDDGGAVREHGERGLNGLVDRVQQATVGEGIRRDVQDAHDARDLAQRERTRAQLPVEMGTAMHVGRVSREHFPYGVLLSILRAEQLFSRKSCDHSLCSVGGIGEVLSNVIE